MMLKLVIFYLVAGHRRQLEKKSMTERQSRKQASSFQSEIIDVEAGAYYDDSEERLVKLSVANLKDAQRS